jgi:lipoprotein
MKKIVLMLLSVVMVASLASCGDNEEPTPKSNNYMMLYRVIMAKNTFNYGNPTLKVLNPVKNTTETIVLTEDMDNRNNTVYSLDYAVVKASIALSLTDPNDLFVYYYPVMDIKREMKFEAELNLNIDDAKTSLVDPVKKVKVTSPKVAASFIETSGALVAIAPVSLSTMTMSGEQSVEYYTKHQQTKASGVVTW